MSCYHPNIALVQNKALLRKDNQIANFTHRIIFANSPEFKGYEFYIKANDELFKKREPYKYQLIPCGKCIGCRTQERKDWTLRIWLESEKYKNNYFLTLTYNPENIVIPEQMTNQKTGEIIENDGTWTGTLVKEHLQQFIKSFRTYCKREFDWDGIRFYACGEYGEDSYTTTFRPHYHVILLNCPEITLERTNTFNPKTKDPYHTNKRIEQIWGKGFIQIDKVTFETIAYTAGYTMKKLFGEVGAEYWAKNGKLPIFANMSRRPGIGKEYYNRVKTEMFEIDEIINHKGQSQKPPRYYMKLLDKEMHEYAGHIKFKREFVAEYEQKKKMQMTDKTIKEQLEINERTAKEKQKRYHRERIKT